MKVDFFTQKGHFHNLHTEDSLFHSDINKRWFIAAVMDGCSSGKESYFISSLYSKLLEKAIASLSEDYIYSDTLTPDQLGECLLEHVFNKTKQSMDLLELDTIEVLATMILMVYNKDSHEIYINTSGDGCFSINNQITNIDQNNIPDFMGYHLNLTFESWLKTHTQAHIQSDVQSASIATDGITKVINTKRGPDEDFLLEYFLTDIHSNKSLIDRYSKLVKKQKLIPADDIAIVGFSL